MQSPNFILDYQEIYNKDSIKVFERDLKTYLKENYGIAREEFKYSM